MRGSRVGYQELALSASQRGNFRTSFLNISGCVTDIVCTEARSVVRRFYGVVCIYPACCSLWFDTAQDIISNAVMEEYNVEEALEVNIVAFSRYAGTSPEHSISHGNDAHQQ